MKYKHLIILGIIGLFFSCKNDTQITENRSPKEETTHLKSDSSKIEFDFPKSWQAIKDPAHPSIINIQQPFTDSQDIFQERLTVWSEQLPMNISDSIYHLTAITSLKISNPSLKIENKGTKRIGNNIFHEYQFNFVPNDSNHYTVVGYTFLNPKDSIGYNFNSTSISTNTQKFIPLVEKILSTFKAL